MRIYLNTNIYCRPFDNLRDAKIFNEAVASLKIFLLVLSKVVSLVASEILLAEINLISEISKKDAVEDLISYLTNIGIKVNKDIEILAEEINHVCHIGDYADSLHLIFAVYSDSSYFITCDSGILKKAQQIEEFLETKGYAISILSPIKFLEKEGVV